MSAPLSESDVDARPPNKMQKTSQEIALCGAPAGGCGFRGRNWRKGQLVNGYSTMDGTPYCACGSQMRPFEPRRFIEES